MADYLLSFDPGTRNIAYCLLRIKTLDIVRWKVFSIAENARETYEVSCEQLIKHLDEDNIFSELNENERINIVLENQMGRNTTTNRVCGMLLMYFLKNRDPRLNKIVHYSAANKINYYQWEEGDPEPVLVQKGKSKKNVYEVNERIAKLKGTAHYKNKKILEEHCRRILKNRNYPQSWIDYFDKNKSKQDDLADSFIQALSYIKYPSGNKDKDWTKNHKQLPNKRVI